MTFSYNEEFNKIVGMMTPYAPGTPEREKYERELRRNLELNPNLAEEIGERCTNVLGKYKAILANGAGLSADVALREFFNTFNQSLWNTGLIHLPSSFNVLHAFMRYNRGLNFLELLPEIDHVFSFEDFLDYVTGPDSPSDPYEAASFFEEGKIHNYTSIDQLKRCTISTLDGSEYAPSSFSIIRRGHEISLLVVAGESVDFSEINKIIEPRKEISKAAAKSIEFLSPDSKKKEVKAVKLNGEKNFWRTLAAVRLNLKEKTVDVRYLYNLHSAALKHDFLNYVESKLRGSKTGILKIHH